MQTGLCSEEELLSYYLCDTKEDLVIAMNDCKCNNVVVKEIYVYFTQNWFSNGIRYATEIAFPKLFKGESLFPCYLVKNPAGLELFTKNGFKNYFIVIK